MTTQLLTKRQFRGIAVLLALFVLCYMGVSSYSKFPQLVDTQAVEQVVIHHHGHSHVIDHHHHYDGQFESVSAASHLDHSHSLWATVVSFILLAAVLRILTRFSPPVRASLWFTQRLDRPPKYLVV